MGFAARAGSTDFLRLVRLPVRGGADDLLLGRAYLRFGRLSLPVGWFALERMTTTTPPPIAAV